MSMNIKWANFDCQFWVTDDVEEYGRWLETLNGTGHPRETFVAFTSMKPNIVYVIIVDFLRQNRKLGIELMHLASDDHPELDQVTRDFIRSLSLSYKAMTLEAVPDNIEVKVFERDPMREPRNHFLNQVMERRERILDHVLAGRDTAHNRSLADFTHQLATSAVLEILDGGDDSVGPGYLVLPATMVRNFENTPSIAGKLTEVFDSYFEDINN